MPQSINCELLMHAGGEQHPSAGMLSLLMCFVPYVELIDKPPNSGRLLMQTAPLHSLVDNLQL